MATAQIEGVTIAYDDTGDGEAVVLIHGHPFDRTMWRPQATALTAAGWRVIVPDLRGYGETTVVPGTTTLDVFARDAARLLDHLGIETFAIGGLSMGGQIVMEICRLFPERVRAVMLAATSASAETEQGKRDRLAMADRLVREGMIGYAVDNLNRMLAPANVTAQPEVAAHVLRMMRNAPTEGAAAALRGRAERPPYEPVLAALRIPALIVVGDQDPFTPQREAERMHALINDSALLCMRGVGHMPNLERVEEFNASLLAFLAAGMVAS